MGQEQSLPASRNRLSKPRTNTSALNLLSRSALHLDRRDAPPKDVPGQANRFSVIFADPESRVPVVKEEERQRDNKRKSIFRSRSTPNRHSDARMENEFEPSTPEDQVYPSSDQGMQNSLPDETHFYQEKLERSLFNRGTS